MVVLLTMIGSASAESRFVVCDSTNALLSGVKMEFLNINTLPLTTSFDGLIRYSFPANVSEAHVMLTANGYDTLRTTIRPSDGLQCIVMHRAFITSHHDEIILYSVGATRTRGPLTTAAKRTVPELEMMIADEAVPEEAASDESVSYEMNAPTAGKLTAGEVNDFAKWHLWESVIRQSHASFVDIWQMNVSERIRVQVTNKQQFPLADVPVTLLDADGHIVFAARTDNTGHAELWFNAFGVVRQAEGLQLVCEADTVALAVPQTFGAPCEQQFVLDQPCGTPDDVDVFFIMDATGSMGDELRYMNAELQDVISRCRSAVDGATIRTGALVYRDHHDDYLCRLSMLSDDMSVTQAFLNKQSASGGGDYPEAIPEALMAAVNVAGWSPHARARIAFLILDAPCHDDSATIALLHEQVSEAAAHGIRIVPVVCSGLREAGELLMRQMALLTNGTSFFLTDDSGIGDRHLKPTTDSLKVEHLNDMLVRTVIEFSRMPECQAQWADSAVVDSPEEAFLPNPFSAEDLPDSVRTETTDLPVYALDEVLTVRPNPCTGFCLVDLPLGADALYLVDLTGKTLRSFGHYPADTRALNVSTAELPTGIYFVKAYVAAHWYTRKLIVR